MFSKLFKVHPSYGARYQRPRNALKSTSILDRLIDISITLHWANYFARERSGKQKIVFACDFFREAPSIQEHSPCQFQGVLTSKLYGNDHLDKSIWRV